MLFLSFLIRGAIIFQGLFLCYVVNFALVTDPNLVTIIFIVLLFFPALIGLLQLKPWGKTAYLYFASALILAAAHEWLSGTPPQGWQYLSFLKLFRNCLSIPMITVYIFAVFIHLPICRPMFKK